MFVKLLEVFNEIDKVKFLDLSTGREFNWYTDISYTLLLKNNTLIAAIS